MGLQIGRPLEILIMAIQRIKAQHAHEQVTSQVRSSAVRPYLVKHWMLVLSSGAELLDGSPLQEECNVRQGNARKAQTGKQ